jgi:dTDP-4-dehydrorhamnose 3,5-epimerase
MKFHELAVPGSHLIEPEPYADARGVLRRHFCAREFQAHGLIPTVAQGNISENRHRHTLRGFHYQDPPCQEAKTLSCIRGALHVIVADLRPKTATYLKWVSAEISEKNRQSLHVPAGCAVAMMTLEDDTVVHYYMSEFFAPNSYRGIRYNDPAFGFVWPAEPRHISDKDKSYPDFYPHKV